MKYPVGSCCVNNPKNKNVSDTELLTFQDQIILQWLQSVDPVALLSLPAQTWFLDISRLMSESLDNKKPTWSKPYLELDWNMIPIKSLQMCLCSNHISECLLSHSQQTTTLNPEWRSYVTDAPAGRREVFEKQIWFTCSLNKACTSVFNSLVVKRELG